MPGRSYFLGSVSFTLFLFSPLPAALRQQGSFTLQFSAVQPDQLQGAFSFHVPYQFSLMYQLPACLLVESTEGKNILELAIPMAHSLKKAEYVSVQNNINICVIFFVKEDCLPVF